MLKRYLIFFILINLLALQSAAQQISDHLLLDFTMRYHFETWQEMNAKNYGDNSENAIGSLNDNILYQRTIAGVKYQPLESLTFTFHLIDARAFGWSLRHALEPDAFKIKSKGTTAPSYTMNPGEEFFELYDAYIDWDLPGRPLRFKFGRQKITFGDYHCFGPGDWGNSGRWTWDAVRITYKKENHTVDFFAGGTKTHDPVRFNTPFTETEFWGGGIYTHFEWQNFPVIEAFYANKSPGSAAFANTGDFNRNWLGLRIFDAKIEPFLADLTYVWQFGNEMKLRTSAYGLFAKLGFQFELPAKPLLSLRYTYASGGSSTSGINRNFDNVFGAGDKFYGWMNIVKWTNIDDRELVLELWPAKGLWIEVKYNRFYIPFTDGFSMLGNLKLLEGQKHLGDEMNVFTRFDINKHFQFIAAYGHFWPGTIQYINNAPLKDAQWVALQILYTL